MKLVLISDTHLKHDIDLPEGDILIHAGDWSARGYLHEAVDFLKWFESQPHKYKIFIAGNHDFVAQTHPDKFLEAVQTYAPSCIYLNEQSVEIEGLKIYGSPWTPWFNNWAFNAKRGSEIQEHWDKIPDDTSILITHGPVQGILDKVLMFRSPNRGALVGCQNLKDTVDSRLKQLKCHVFGHIHEQYGRIEVNNITYANASILNENYQKKNKPIIVVL